MKRTGWVMAALFVVFLLAAGYAVPRMPAQKLNITASTQAAEYDMAGVTDIWYLAPLDAGTKHEARIRFMAVENGSGSLFVRHGSGQYVFMGCGELTGRCEFISVGRFLHVVLTMNASQTELKLEDGTPFDTTRYSLKPVLTIEE